MVIEPFDDAVVIGADDLVRSRRDAFGFFEHPDEVVHIREPAHIAHAAYTVAGLAQQLFGKAHSFAVDVFQRRDAELFAEPFKENVAAEIGLFAERVYRDLFGEVLADIIEHKMLAAVIIADARFRHDLLQVLALHEADEQFFQVEVCEDVLRRVPAAANADKFVDEAGDLVVVLEMIGVELEFPVAVFVGALVIVVEIVHGFTHVMPVYRQRDALGGRVHPRVGEIYFHGLVGRENNGFAGKVIERRAAGKMHYFFAAHHTGDQEVVERQRNAKGPFITFEYVQLAVVEIKYAAVFHQRAQVFRRCKLDRFQETFTGHSATTYYKLRNFYRYGMKSGTIVLLKSTNVYSC